MSKQIKLTIDGNSFEVSTNATLMDAITKAGKSTPVICYHPATTSEGICRICVVEVEGWRRLAPACITKVEEGMVIKTNSTRVKTARKTILEMLNASTDLSEAPNIQKLMDEYDANQTRFPEAQQRRHELLDDNPFYIRDYEKCILCWRCVQACGDDLQFTYALSLGGRGHETRISTFFNSPMPETTCVFCGNCVAVCPTNALVNKTEFFLDRGKDFDQIRQEKRKSRQQHLTEKSNG
jgi:NADH dehydrogenase/NADH:ubiquinone oxidoreductase subunit G